MRVSSGLRELEAKSAMAAQMLKLIANERRLLILCRLAVEREMSVGALAKAVRLGQSALSQHLAKMRDEGVLATRRDAQTVFYRIADRNVSQVLKLLKEIYCP